MCPVGDQEEAMQSQSVDLVEMFVGLMPDAAVVVNGDGVIVAANELAQALFGYPADDLMGRPIELLVPERYRHAHRSDRADYFAEPRTRPMGAGLELTGRRRDGSEFAVDISLAPVSPDGGEPLVVAAVRDATERRTATAASAQLAAIVQSSTDAIVSMSAAGEIRSWNPGAQRLFGHAPEEAVGCHISMIVPDDRSAELEELMSAAMTGTLVAPRDTVWSRQDGALVDVAMSVSPLFDAGQLLGFSILLRDITERKRTEAELRRLLVEVQWRERWQAVTAEIRLAMLDGQSIDETLQLLCQRATELLHAREAFIVGYVAGRPAIIASAGDRTPTEAALFERLASTAENRTTMELTDNGTSISVQIVPDDPSAGLFVVRGLAEGDGIRGDPTTTPESLADQAALAVELSRARQREEQMLLLGDRERIARDLHDLVIQRLFGTGIALQSALRVIQDPAAANRVSTAIDDLDTTIRDIRSTIFELEPPPQSQGGVREEILKLASRAAEGLGFQPAVQFSGPIDSVIDKDLAHHLLAAAQEGLSNAARHARAASIRLILSVDAELRLEVLDDGVGVRVGEGTRRSGLANLEQRAASLGGSSSIEPRPNGGTRFVWLVPLHGARPTG